MTKRVKSVIGGIVFIFALMLFVFVSIFAIPTKDTSAIAALGAPGCPMTNNQGTGLYNQSSASRGEGEGWSETMTAISRQNSSDFKKVLYGKPDEWIEFTHCYFPGLQRIASKLVTTNHPAHSSWIANENSNIFPVTNNTLGALSRSEASGHLTVSVSVVPYKMLDTGSYTYAPNFITVTRLDGLYGGMGIFNGIDPGRDGIMYVTNGWKIGRNESIDGQPPVQWKVGRNFTEVSYLPYNTHGWITKDEDRLNTWPCYYKKDETYYGESAKQFPSCKTGQYEKKLVGECTNRFITNKNGCQAAGFQWKERLVDDTDKPIYKNPCTVTVTKSTSCRHDNANVYSYHSNNEGTKRDSAELIIPYNYELEPSVGIQNSIVYAGETATLQNTKATVKARYNSETQGTYATDVPYVELKLTTYIATDANGNNEVSGTRNERTKVYDSGSTALYPSTWEYSFDTSTVSVQDTNAGNYFCARMTVYPTSSGDPTNYSDPQGNHSSGTSGSVCRIIAKRPTFQVWGGSIFSNGAIDVSRTTKNNLQGNPDRPYRVAVPADGNVFGSWAELGVTALGKNGGDSGKGMASASATAGTWGRYETSTSTGLCKFESMLTFANYNKSAALAFCNGTTNLNTNGYFGLGSAAGITKRTLIDDIWKYEDSPIASGDLNNFVVGAPATYKEYMNANGKLVRYSYVTGNVGINSAGADPMRVEQGVTGEGKKSTTYIVWSDKNVKIYKNIQYPDTYQSLDDIPKVVIYAKGDINIWCGVTRIDAVLIAEGTINTCNDDGNSSVSRNVQLKINGALIADRLLLNRTYGAGPGAASGVPAEIINYDTSMLLWGQSQADISASGKMSATYTRELAPRY